MKVSGSKFIILVLYVDNILLVVNDVCMLHDVKKFFSNNFEMKYMAETSYVIEIEIFRNRSQEKLGLSREGYINKILERFFMENYSARIVPIQKVNNKKCSKSDLERKVIESIPYASIVGSLMYIQTCTRPIFSFADEMLGQY